MYCFLKRQCIFINLTFSMSQGSRYHVARFSAQVSDLMSRCGLVLKLSAGAWGSFPSSLIVGRIHFLAPVGLMSLLSYWFLTVDCSQPLEAVPLH